MDWVESDIAIGNHVDAKDVEVLKGAKIASALSLDGTLAGIAPSTLGLKRIEVVRLDDGPGNDARIFRMAVRALEFLTAEHAPVLVQCHAGRSRSVVVVAGFLMLRLNLGADAALDRVRARREGTLSPGLRELLDGLEPA